MTMLTIDTLALANKLKKAGAEGKQAEAMAEAIATGISGAGGELATKVDMANLETRLTNRIYAVAVGQAALTITAVGILFRLMVGGE